MGGAGDRVDPGAVPDVGALPRRVDQWVDHAEAVLRDAPVEPPYRLVGWSFGGVVALELARRLRGEGTEVSYVGMIDTTRPRRAPLADRDYIWYHLAAAAELPDERERLPYLGSVALFLADRRFPRAEPGTRYGARASRAARRAEQEAIVKPHRSAEDLDPHRRTCNYRGDAGAVPGEPLRVPALGGTGAGPTLGWSGLLHGGYELA